MVGKTAVGVGIDEFEDRVIAALGFEPGPLGKALGAPVWPPNVIYRRTPDSIEWEFIADRHNRRLWVRFDGDTVIVEGTSAGAAAYTVPLRGVPVEATVALTVALLVRLLWEVTM